MNEVNKALVTTAELTRKLSQIEGAIELLTPALSAARAKALLYNESMRCSIYYSEILKKLIELTKRGSDHAAIIINIIDVMCKKDLIEHIHELPAKELLGKIRRLFVSPESVLETEWEEAPVELMPIITDYLPKDNGYSDQISDELSKFDKQLELHRKKLPYHLRCLKKRLQGNDRPHIKDEEKFMQECDAELVDGQWTWEQILSENEQKRLHEFRRQIPKDQKKRTSLEETFLPLVTAIENLDRQINEDKKLMELENITQSLIRTLSCELYYDDVQRSDDCPQISYQMYRKFGWSELLDALKELKSAYAVEVRPVSDTSPFVKPTEAGLPTWKRVAKQKYLERLLIQFEKVIRLSEKQDEEQDEEIPQTERNYISRQNKLLGKTVCKLKSKLNKIAVENATVARHSRFFKSNGTWADSKGNWKIKTICLVTFGSIFTIGIMPCLFFPIASKRYRKPESSATLWKAYQTIHGSK